MSDHNKTQFTAAEHLMLHFQLSTTERGSYSASLRNKKTTTKSINIFVNVQC